MDLWLFLIEVVRFFHMAFSFLKTLLASTEVFEMSDFSIPSAHTCIGMVPKVFNSTSSASDSLKMPVYDAEWHASPHLAISSMSPDTYFGNKPSIYKYLLAILVFLFFSFVVWASAAA